MIKKKLLITGATGNVGSSILSTIDLDLFDYLFLMRPHKLLMFQPFMK